ncbi:putative phosphomevalonate kinase protein [Phaeoacremonium minimum UCRPA7]|uniref:Phosphomevalonate kinase n=1 Tax=Phaeoacremonium minimum (strain UCR-PA7) TaxID=1286976 RepID=R8BE41_PHAM7|nr:putative phosphomevalonate kinase protein [Phaeoacremonium minimum UCRPA7]EON97567.1 putative phosphomevalonate kinase protein [Phaeoacremonium minimum UCRPA7]
MPGANPTTAVSAPGKVLLAGGYLVLDRAYTGLVFGLSARISVIAQEIHTSQGVQLTEIVVDSPQFLDAQWRYGYHLADEDGGIKVTQLHVGSNLSANPFVEATLSYVLTYISRVAHYRPSHSVKSARLTILADNDYYSQPDSSLVDTKAVKIGSGRFAVFPTTLKGANKTGLGSSAALVTSLTASLLAHYLHPMYFDINTDKGRRTLHNLAQAAHCAAQGKVGSGFDVAAAVYGSCLYTRFSPSILSALPEPGSPGFGSKLETLVSGEAEDARWDTEVTKDGISLPAGVAMRMCDVDCGSQTVGMVKQVLAWRASDPEGSKALWDSLQKKNEALAAALRDGDLDGLPVAIGAVRELVRKMGAESGVPIEPESQTELLDALSKVDGVFGGVVPGAGGYDAVALLVKDDDGTTKGVEDFLTKWTKEKGTRVRLLPVKGELEGARMEKLNIYDGWLRK